MPRVPARPHPGPPPLPLSRERRCRRSPDAEERGAAEAWGGRRGGYRRAATRGRPGGMLENGALETIRTSDLPLRRVLISPLRP
ncbi:hypothetical protein ATSB10_07060 [Dyella thiooxydans]|uniref:Uncharacterized protein n=1 Tax=Dyella thiooxydans TaxID=445710 RepID=A0A160MY54_9GAMM|nr:hypothetical protein ATSB10_07060 [Dyella thiooxydans]